MRGMIGRLLASCACVTAAAAAQAQVSDDVVRIGVLTDMSGIYSDLAGEGAVEAVRVAPEGDPLLYGMRQYLRAEAHEGETED